MRGRLSTQAEWRKIYATAKFQLVSTELDLAITFCNIASTTNDRARSERNLANAARVYACAANYLDDDLNLCQNSEISEKLMRLEFLLADLGRGIAVAESA